MLSGKQVREALDRITVGPSMLFDGGFRFEVTPASTSNGTGFFIQFFYRRPDTNTGEIGEGDSRREFVPTSADEDSVIKTGFVLMKAVVEHEWLECFLVDGVRVFDPHQSIAQLQAGKAQVWVFGSKGEAQ